MSGFRIVPLTGDLVMPAFDLASEVFATRSPLHQALGIGLDAYRQALWPAFEGMVKEGHSFVACDRAQLLGCLIATDITLSHPVGSCSEVLAPIAALTQRLKEGYLDHRKPKFGEVLLIDMAAVPDRYRGQGVYKSLRRACHEAAKSRGFDAVVGELSSPATQSVVMHQFGHHKIAEIDLAQFEFSGTRPFAGITAPKSVILAEGKL